LAESARRLFPQFRYHPFPIYTKAFDPTPITCPLCGLDSEYSYSFLSGVPKEGPENETDNEVRVCPWCLHEGSAARAYPGVTVIDPPASPEVSAEARDELAHRTPPYYGFQEIEWAVHHGDYCAFIAYAGWKEVLPYAKELASDITRLRRSMGWNKADLESLRNGASVQGYLFRCTTCGVHKLLFDLE